MSYNYTTDFLGLLRLTGGGARSERMPGLDYVVMALNRMGLFAVSVGQTAPVANQATTIWLQPALPSWSAEGVLYLWNPSLAGGGAYQPATPALWQIFLNPAGYVFEALTAANNVINAGVSMAAVQRAAPAATAVVLPNLAAQFFTQKDIDLVDYSTNVVNHVITITPTGAGVTIMQRPSLQLLSTADNLGGVRLRACPDLNAWVYP